MSIKLKSLLIASAILLTAGSSWANNLVIENFGVSSMSEASNMITFTLDASWENSWRSTENHDAVWIFMKYSTDAGTTWNHASMASTGINPNSFSNPFGFEIIVPSDETGFFLQRTDLSSGAVSAEGVEFVWDYSQDGLTDAEATAANTITRVFGIEMVYIPQGSFYAGDGNSSSDYSFVQGTADTEPWYIQSEAAFTTTNAAADGYYYTSGGSSGESSTGSIFTVPTSYPKGYNDFYIMKYELTEGQWVGFFNTLSEEKRLNRDITSASEGGKGSDAVVTRNTISWDSSDPSSNATTSRPDRPVSYISWPDLMAYADWAGLRPMTELEYEKAARGKDISAVANEYVWGSTTLNAALASEIFPNDDEDGTERIFDSSANINSNSLAWSSGDGRSGGEAEGQSGPLRVGIFAEVSTNRATSGAGYYGAMELAGNLSEMVVSIGRGQGRQYLGTHGDGELTELTSYEGNATNSDWPGINGTDTARGVTGTVGMGYRGGDFNSANSRLFQTSTRTYAATDADSEGYSQRYDASFGVYSGGRLARTAP